MMCRIDSVIFYNDDTYSATLVYIKIFFYGDTLVLNHFAKNPYNRNICSLK